MTQWETSSRKKSGFLFDPQVRNSLLIQSGYKQLMMFMELFTHSVFLFFFFIFLLKSKKRLSSEQRGSIAKKKKKSS